MVKIGGPAEALDAVLTLDLGMTRRGVDRTLRASGGEQRCSNDGGPPRLRRADQREKRVRLGRHNVGNGSKADLV